MTKIAIIEDDVAITQMYQLKFESDGFEVVTAENGLMGVELAEKTKPDVILVDLMMPEMSGQEVVARIRAADWGRQMRIIILTNVSQDRSTAELDQFHVDRYVIKANYTPAQIVDIIKEVLASPLPGGQ